MISISTVSQDKGFFKGLKAALAENKIKTDWLSTGADALSTLGASPVDVVIIEENLPDMTGRQFVEHLVSQAPMTHCVVASPLSHGEFHERYEGFGVLMQFSVSPKKMEIKNLLDHLNHIADLQKKTKTSPGGLPR